MKELVDLRAAVQLRPKGLPSILNRAAREALSPKGQRYVMAFQRGGKLCLKAFDEEGLISIAPLNDFSAGRGQVSLWLDLTKNYRVVLEWNEEGQYFETGEVLRRYARARAPRKTAVGAA